MSFIIIHPFSFLFHCFRVLIPVMYGFIARSLIIFIVTITIAVFQMVFGKYNFAFVRMTRRWKF